MLHVMDYEDRDDFNTWWLQIASASGVVTILSGFELAALTSPRLRRLFDRRKTRRSFASPQVTEQENDIPARAGRNRSEFRILSFGHHAFHHLQRDRFIGVDSVFPDQVALVEKAK